MLAEKASEDNEIELLTAGKKFRLLATMNPGGDFGKKEVMKTSLVLCYESHRANCSCDVNS